MAKKKPKPGISYDAKCPVTVDEFRAKAKPILFRTADQQLTTTIVVAPRRFASGSLGWFHTQPVDLVIDGVLCRGNLQICLTLHHSKFVEESRDEQRKEGQQEGGEGGTTGQVPHD